MPYPYKPILAIDPSRPEHVAATAPITLFAPGDATETPIAITDLTGVPLPNPITTNALGFASAFLADIPEVAWSGAGLTGVFESTVGLKEAAEAAAASAAETLASVPTTVATEVATAVVPVQEAAEASATSSDASAQSSEASAQAAQDAANLVNAPAGDVIRSTVEGDLDTPASGIATRLSAAIADHAVQARDVFGRLDLRDPGAVVIAGAGDSTTDSAGEYLETGLKEAVATLYPERPAGVRRYSKGTETLLAYSTWQDGSTPGTPETTETNKVIGLDTFTRTAADLVGTSPETGAAAWSGNAAAFSLTGTRVDYVNAAGGSPFAVFKTNTRTGLGIDVTATLRMAFNLGSSTQTRLMVARAATATADRLDINVSGTSTTTTVLRKLIGGVTTTLATFPAGTIPNGSAAADYAFRITVTDAGAITATVNGQTVTAQLDAADITALTGDTWIGFSSYNAEFEADNIQATGTVTTPASDPIPSTLGTLTVYNGGYAGGRASHQIDRFAAMYPVKPDLFLISHGHNYATVDSTPAAFITAIEALVAKLHEVYPGVPVGFVSQNPEKVADGSRTQAQVAEHLARQQAMRAHCVRKGWVYIPAMEAFTARTDGGASLIQTDGVHVDAATSDPNNITGGRVAADAFKAWITAQSLRP